MPTNTAAPGARIYQIQRKPSDLEMIQVHLVVVIDDELKKGSSAEEEPSL